MICFTMPLGAYLERPGMTTEILGGYFLSTAAYLLASWPSGIVTGKCRVPTDTSSCGFV